MKDRQEDSQALYEAGIRKANEENEKCLDQVRELFNTSHSQITVFSTTEEIQPIERDKKE